MHAVRLQSANLDRCGHFIFDRFLSVRSAKRIVGTSEDQPRSASFVKVHLPAANMTGRLILDFFPACIRSELPAADKADKALLAASGPTVFI